MMKLTYTKQVTVKEEIEVDDRVYQNHDSLVWEMVNILLDNRFSRVIDDLYKEDEYAVRTAADRINEAFKKADACLELVRSGKFEI